MTAQQNQSDPNTSQTEGENVQCDVQVDRPGKFDPGLNPCSVWWLVVRRPGEEDGGVELSLDPSGVTRDEIEHAVATMAGERGEACVLWLLYEHEGAGGSVTYERPAGWCHPSGRFLWSWSVRPGSSVRKAGPGIDPVQVLSNLGESAVDVVDALIGDEGGSERRRTMRSDGPAPRGRLSKRFVSVWEDGSAAGDVPSVEIFSSGYGRAEMLRIASRMISGMAAVASEEGGCDAY